jgi:hypothetical protein
MIENLSQEQKDILLEQVLKDSYYKYRQSCIEIKEIMSRHPNVTDSMIDYSNIKVATFEEWINNIINKEFIK